MEEKQRSFVKDLVISLLIGYVISIIGIVILAFLLLLLQISEEVVDIGILVIYMISCFGAGFVIGKKRKARKFIWGMLVGGMYYAILFLLSYVLKHSPDTAVGDLITSLLICWGSATLGGMLS